jgi:hypothetical protein
LNKAWQAAWLLGAVTCVDLTTLQGDDTEGRRNVESASIGNMKRTFAHLEDDFSVDRLTAAEALRESTHIKNSWIPFGA